MMTLYDELLEKHQSLQRDVQGEIPEELREQFVQSIYKFIKNIVDAGEFIGNLRQREKLRDLLRFWGTWIYDQKGEYPQAQLQPFKAEKRSSRRTMLLISVATLFLVGIIIVAVLRLSDAPILQPSVTEMRAISPPAVSPPLDCSDFWSGAKPPLFRWRPQTNDRQAVLEVSQSGNLPSNVLQLQVELDGQDERKNGGEAFIDLRYDFPRGPQAPLNLDGVPITMAVYAPARAAGTTGQPNYVQIFVKSLDTRDDSFKSEYGTWENLTDNTDRWLEVSLTPARTPPPDGRMDPGFDPANIVLIGINIATQEGAAVKYSGPIWISDVCWQMQ